MSNKTRLQTNNTNLQNLINKANNLPDAGSGGSSGGLQTSSIRVGLTEPGGMLYYIDSDMNVQCTTSKGLCEAVSGTIAVGISGAVISEGAECITQVGMNYIYRVN